MALCLFLPLVVVNRAAIDKWVHVFVSTDVGMNTCFQFLWIDYKIPVFESAVYGERGRYLVVVVVRFQEFVGLRTGVHFLDRKCNSAKVLLRLPWRKHHLKLAYPCGKSDRSFISKLGEAYSNLLNKNAPPRSTGSRRLLRVASFAGSRRVSPWHRT